MPWDALQRQPLMHWGCIDEPLPVRDKIYRCAFREGEDESLSWDESVAPYVPTQYFGLLYSSRQVYAEASAILHSRVNLGSDARLARDYLEFIGPARPCIGDWSGRDHYLESMCRLTWDVRVDCFWPGLTTMNMAQEIRFVWPVPECYAKWAAKELGWEMEGVSSDRLQKLAGPREKTEHFRLLDLPLEIRQQIYGHALEWVCKLFWPTQRARWSPGVGLLRTCRQIAAEAAPFMHRSFDDKWRVVHVRTAQIQFTCFCPSGGKNLQHDTIYAALSPEFSDDFRPPCLSSDQEERAKLVQDIKDAWNEAIGRLQALNGRAELAITFQSCCRSTSYQPRLHLNGLESPFSCFPYEGVDPTRLHRVELENHFTDLLWAAAAAFNGFAVRLAQPYPASVLSIRFTNKAMMAFMKDTEAERADWQKMVEYAELQLTSTVLGATSSTRRNTQPPHFILTRECSAQDKWMEHAVPEGGRSDTRMELVVGAITQRPWQELKEFMDCDGNMGALRVEELTEDNGFIVLNTWNMRPLPCYQFWYRGTRYHHSPPDTQVLSLSVKAFSNNMADFTKNVEEHRAQWEDDVEFATMGDEDNLTWTETRGYISAHELLRPSNG
ncbi:hypothetical protein B0I37DRAFT_401612 [Chaetomium sp. MPI-CAGE-AT-0009]|nr:hypothetical protein B0I37DRAFT_401612 [Chaetomium sp. MPI-CAGE-AT-0009]